MLSKLSLFSGVCFSDCDGNIIRWLAAKMAGWCLLNRFIYYGREAADWMRIKVTTYQTFSLSNAVYISFSVFLHCLSIVFIPHSHKLPLNVSFSKSILHLSLALEFIGRIYWLTCVKRQKSHASKYLRSSSAWARWNWFLLLVSLKLMG